MACGSSGSATGPSFKGRGSASAVDRDRQRVKQDHVRGIGNFALQTLEHEPRARSGRQQAYLDLVDRREHHELLLERARESAAAEVPAVELLQEAVRTLLTELAHRLADEEHQFGDDL